MNTPDNPTNPINHDGHGVAPAISPNPGEIAALYRDWVDICRHAQQAGRLDGPIPLILDGDHNYVAHVRSHNGGGHLHVHPSLATEPSPARRWVLAHELGHLIAGHTRMYAVFNILRTIGRVMLLIGIVMTAVRIIRDEPLTAGTWLGFAGAAVTILTSSSQLRAYERAADHAAASIGYPLNPPLAELFARDDDPITRITNHAPWSTHPPWNKRHTTRHQHDHEGES